MVRLSGDRNRTRTCGLARRQTRRVCRFGFADCRRSNRRFERGTAAPHRCERCALTSTPDLHTRIENPSTSSACRRPILHKLPSFLAPLYYSSIVRCNMESRHTCLSKQPTQRTVPVCSSRMFYSRLYTQIL